MSFTSNGASQQLYDSFGKINDAISPDREQHDGASMARSISSLTAVLRTCHGLMENFQEEQSTSNFSSRMVVRLLEKCMKVRDEKRKPLRSRGATTSSLSFEKKNCGRSYSLHLARFPAIISNEEAPLAFIYENPITIPSSFDFELIDFFGVSNVCMCLSSVCTFNLALLHQLAAKSLLTSIDEACSPPPKYGALLRKAARLYEIALDIKDDGEDDQESLEPCLFGLAIANNLSIALFDMDEAEEATEYLKEVLSTLMFLLTTAAARAEANPLSSTDIDGFLRNISVVNKTFVVAPAA